MCAFERLDISTCSAASRYLLTFCSGKCLARGDVTRHNLNKQLDCTMQRQVLCLTTPLACRLH